VLTRPVAGEFHGPSHILPGSEGALITVNSGLGEARQMIALVSLKTGAIRKQFVGSSPRYVRGGFLVFRRLDAVHVAPFDLGRLEVTGDPRPVLQDVNYYYYSGHSAFDVSRDGALIYTPGAPRAENSELVWLDRQGRLERLADERQPYSRAELDPEGRRVAVHINSTLDDGDLSVYDIRARSWTRLTQGFETIGTIAWSPDGQWIVSSTKRSGYPKLFRIRANGGAPEPLTDGIAMAEWAHSFYDNVVLFGRQAWSGSVALMTLTLDPRGAPAPLPHFEAIGPKKFSPDGAGSRTSRASLGRSRSSCSRIGIRISPDVTSSRLDGAHAGVETAGVCSFVETERSGRFLSTRARATSRPAHPNS
jgi:hypothetical protein